MDQKLKFDKYTASRLPDAKQLARDEGHTEEPVYAYCGGGIWTVFYRATSPVAAHPRLRTARISRWSSGILLRFAIGTQHPTLQEQRHG